MYKLVAFLVVPFMGIFGSQSSSTQSRPRPIGLAQGRPTALSAQSSGGRLVKNLGGDVGALTKNGVVVRTYKRSSAAGLFSEDSRFALSSEGKLYYWEGALPLPDAEHNQVLVQEGFGRRTGTLSLGKYAEVGTKSLLEGDAVSWYELENPLNQKLSSSFLGARYSIDYGGSKIAVITLKKDFSVLRRDLSLTMRPDSKKLHSLWLHYGGHLTGDQVEHIPYRNQREIQSIKGHTGTITCASLDSSRSCFLTGSDDQTARLWELDTNRAEGGNPTTVCRNKQQCLKTFLHDQPLISIAFNYDDSLVHTRTRHPQNQAIQSHVWDLQSETKVAEFPFQNYARPLLFHPTLPLVAVVDRDGMTVKLFDYVSKKVILACKNKSEVARLIFNRGGSFLASVCSHVAMGEPEITVWSLEDILADRGLALSSDVKDLLKLYTPLSCPTTLEGLPNEIDSGIRGLTSEQIGALNKYGKRLKEESPAIQSSGAPAKGEMEQSVFDSLPLVIQDCFIEKNRRVVLDYLWFTTTHSRDLILAVRELNANQCALLIAHKEASKNGQQEVDGDFELFESLPDVIKKCFDTDFDYAVTYLSQRASLDLEAIGTALYSLTKEQRTFVDEVITLLKAAENDDDPTQESLEVDEGLLNSLPAILKRCLFLAED